jgi:hypothetical protein
LSFNLPQPPGSYRQKLAEVIHTPVQPDCQTLRDSVVRTAIVTPFLRSLTLGVGVEPEAILAQQNKAAEFVGMVDLALSAATLSDLQTARQELLSRSQEMSSPILANTPTDELADQLRAAENALQTILDQRAGFIGAITPLEDRLEELAAEVDLGNLGKGITSLAREVEQLKSQTDLGTLAQLDQDRLGKLQLSLETLDASYSQQVERLATSLEQDIEQLVSDLAAPDYLAGKRDYTGHPVAPRLIDLENRVTEPKLQSTLPTGRREELERQLAAAKEVMAGAILIRDTPRPGLQSTPLELEKAAVAFTEAAEAQLASPTCPEVLREMLTNAVAGFTRNCQEQTLRPFLGQLETIEAGLEAVSVSLSKNQGALAGKEVQTQVAASLANCLDRIHQQIGSLEERLASGGGLAGASDTLAGRDASTPRKVTAETRYVSEQLTALRKMENDFFTAASRVNKLKRSAAIQVRGGLNIDSGQKTLAATALAISRASLPPTQVTQLQAALVAGNLTPADRETLTGFLQSALTGKERQAIADTLTILAGETGKLSPTQTAAVERYLATRVFSPETSSALAEEIRQQSQTSLTELGRRAQTLLADALGANPPESVRSDVLKNLGSRLSNLSAMGGNSLSVSDRPLLEETLDQTRSQALPQLMKLALATPDLESRYQALNPDQQAAFQELCLVSWGNTQVLAAVWEDAARTGLTPGQILDQLGEKGPAALAVIDKLLINSHAADPVALELKSIYNSRSAAPLSPERLTAAHDASRAVRLIRELLTAANPSLPPELQAALAMNDSDLLAHLLDRLGKDGGKALGRDLGAIDILLLRAAYREKTAQTGLTDRDSFTDFQNTLPTAYRGRTTLQADLESGHFSTQALEEKSVAFQSASHSLANDSEIRSVLTRLGRTSADIASGDILRVALTKLFGLEAVRHKSLDELATMFRAQSETALAERAGDASLLNQLSDLLLLGGSFITGRSSETRNKLADLKTQLQALGLRQGALDQLNQAINRRLLEITGAQTAVEEAGARHLKVLSDISRQLPEAARIVVDGTVVLDNVRGKELALGLTALQDIIEDTGLRYGPTWKDRQQAVKNITFQKNLDFLALRGAFFASKLSRGSSDLNSPMEIVEGLFKQIKANLVEAKTAEAFAAASQEMRDFFDQQQLEEKIAAVVFFKKPRENSAVDDLREKSADITNDPNLRKQFIDLFTRKLLPFNAAGSKALQATAEILNQETIANTKSLDAAKKRLTDVVSSSVQDAIRNFGVASLMLAFRQTQASDFSAFVKDLADPASNSYRAWQEIISGGADRPAGLGEQHVRAIIELTLPLLDQSPSLEDLAKNFHLGIADHLRTLYQSLTTPHARNRLEVSAACHALCQGVTPGTHTAVNLEKAVHIQTSFDATGPLKLEEVTLGLELARQHGIAITCGSDGQVTLDLKRELSGKLSAGVELLDGFLSAEAGVGGGVAAGYQLTFQDDPGGLTAHDKLEVFLTALFTGRMDVPTASLGSNVERLSEISGQLTLEAAVSLGDGVKGTVAGVAKKELNSQGLPQSIQSEVNPLAASAVSTLDANLPFGQKVARDSLTSASAKAGQKGSDAIAGGVGSATKAAVGKAVGLGLAANFSLGANRQVRESGDTLRVSQGFQMRASLTAKGNFASHSGEKEVDTDITGNLEQISRGGQLVEARLETSKNFSARWKSHPEAAVELVASMEIDNQGLLDDLKTLVESGVPVRLFCQRSLTPSARETLSGLTAPKQLLELLNTGNYVTSGLRLEYDVTQVTQTFATLSCDSVGYVKTATGSRTRSLSYFTA